MLHKIKKVIKNLLRSFKPKYIPSIELKENSNLLKGKVALITGGAGGIGFAIAKKYVECGAFVIIAGRNEEKLKESCKKIKKNCSYVVVDLYDFNSYESVIKKAVSIYGKIDILVNSAGMHISREGMEFINFTEQEYDQILNLNLKASYFFTQKMALYFIENKIHAHILFISSQSALEPAWSPYRLSKRGIEAITEGIAQDLLRYNIIVNGIGPGPTATEMQNYSEGNSIYTELNCNNRYTLPLEIAEYAKLLVSDLGNTIIGQTIYMSGGRGIIDKR